MPVSVQASRGVTARMARGNGSRKDRELIVELDRKYQEAVRKNDAAVMDDILADSFVLVTGLGKVLNKSDLLREARSGRVRYERQEDTEQSVRIMDDTAVITAKLWAKGTEDGEPFNYHLWFSDTYVRTSGGWKYFFGQASTRIQNDD